MIEYNLLTRKTWVRIPCGSCLQNRELCLLQLAGERQCVAIVLQGLGLGVGLGWWLARGGEGIKEGRTLVQ